jgi:hypothetical protein
LKAGDRVIMLNQIEYLHRAEIGRAIQWQVAHEVLLICEQEQRLKQSTEVRIFTQARLMGGEVLQQKYLMALKYRKEGGDTSHFFGGLIYRTLCLQDKYEYLTHDPI